MSGFAVQYIPEKVLIWLKIYLIGLVQFAFFRLLFFVFYKGSAGDPGFWLLIKSFIVGLRFDTVVLAAIILPLFLVHLIPGITFRKKTIRIIFRLVLSVIFALIIFLNAADLGFFKQFGSRLNYWAVEYIDDPGWMLHAVISYSETWLLLLMFIVIAAVFIFLLSKVITVPKERTIRPGRITRYVFYILVVVLLVLGIRGRLGIKPLDWGEAFFSENHFINQMTLNGVYTLAHSLYEEAGRDWDIYARMQRRLKIIDDDSAYKIVKDMLAIDSKDSEENYSLVRKSVGKEKPEFLPNIVIVLLESWSAKRIGVYGDTLGITPCFDSLAGSGILFKNFYANGVRTNRGITASLSSFPSLPGRSIMKRFSAEYPFRSIAEVLKPFGYTSAFGYGGDIQFDNMQGFLRRVGFTRFYDEEDFGDVPKLGKWGVPDDIFFEQMAEKMDSLPRPFVSAMMTLSFHDPFLIPDDRFGIFDESVTDYRRLNCLYYSDWSIGRFMDTVRSYPYFDSTIFIFTADHCDIQSTRYPLSPDNFRIPLLIYAPSITGDSMAVIGKTASQVDILPSVLDLLDLSAVHESWGKSIFDSTNGIGFAVIVNGDKLGLIEDSLFYFNMLDAAKALYNLNEADGLDKDIKDSYPDLSESMRRRLGAYLQMAELLSSRKDYDTAGE